MGYIDIVFDGPHTGDKNPGFIEVEDSHGNSIALGKWLQRDDGCHVLRIEVPGDRSEDFQARLPRSMEGEGLSVVPSYTEAGYFGEANVVTVTDGERTALYARCVQSGTVKPRRMTRRRGPARDSSRTPSTNRGITARSLCQARFSDRCASGSRP
jgi:hypothetical protein